MKKETFVEGLYKGAKRPQCNPSFMNKIEANDLDMDPSTRNYG